MKAVGTGWSDGVRWVDIETGEGARPGALELALHGRAREVADSLGGSRAHLAVSHSRTHAVAMVLLERRAE